MNKKKLKVTLFVSLYITGLYIAGMTVGCAQKVTEERENEKIPVHTEIIRMEKIAVPIQSSGKLSSKMEMRLSFKTGGIVEKTFFDEGQTMKEGQLLAQLDLSEINAGVKKARASFEKAERDHNRVQKLYDEKVTTLEQLQDAETALDIAAASVKAVDFNLLYSSIYAPSDGRILKRFVEPGELVSAGTPVFLFGSSVSDWIVRVGVTDAEVIRLRINDTASVSFDMYPEKSFPAHVSEIAETADPLSGTYEIELTMGKSEYRLISGFIAKLKIIPSLKEDLFVIPVESLVEGDGRKGFVYVLERPNNRVRKAPVLIRYIFDDAIAVEYGLKEGDEIITMGTAYLTEGARVKIAETAPNENLKSNS